MTPELRAVAGGLNRARAEKEGRVPKGSRTGDRYFRVKEKSPKDLIFAKDNADHYLFAIVKVQETVISESYLYPSENKEGLQELLAQAAKKIKPWWSFRMPPQEEVALLRHLSKKYPQGIKLDPEPARRRRGGL